MKPYYEEDGITIYHGDCREILPQLGPVDVVITDPPYGVNLAGKIAKQRNGSRTRRDLVYTQFQDTSEYFDEVVLPAIKQALSQARRAAITPGTRMCFRYPEPAEIGCFFSAAGTGVGRWGFSCSQPILYYGVDPFLEHCAGFRPNSCGQIWPNDANVWDHPCAKPMPQMRWLVGRASWEGDIVLDPFMGSGTTLVAAKNLGRKAIGIEIEEKYCEIAVKRLAQSVLPFGVNNR